MSRVLVIGATGRLGTPICRAVADADDLVLAGRVARTLDGDADGGFGELASAIPASGAEVVLDVSLGPLALEHARSVLATGLPLVVGSTGIAAADLEAIDVAAREAGCPALHVPNFAIGAVLMMRFAALAARLLPDCAIVEEHHTEKRDAPSGTALRTADLVEAASGVRPTISSIRMEGVVANQTVLFGGPAQTLEIRNVTTAREAFVPGALLALRRITTLPAGLHVGLESILDLG